MRTTISWRVAGCEQIAIERRLLADVLPQHLPAVDLREQRPAVERIDDQEVVASVHPRALVGARRRKWPGKFTPETRQPARRAISR